MIKPHNTTWKHYSEQGKPISRYRARRLGLGPIFRPTLHGSIQLHVVKRDVVSGAHHGTSLSYTRCHLKGVLEALAWSAFNAISSDTEVDNLWELTW
jgi:hypothetical protein